MKHLLNLLNIDNSYEILDDLDIFDYMVIIQKKYFILDDTIFSFLGYDIKEEISLINHFKCLFCFNKFLFYFY